MGSDLKAVQCLKPADWGVAANEGAAVDCSGFHDALVVLNTGTATGSGTLNVKVQESADGSTGWADIAGAAFDQVAAANDDTLYQGRVKMTPTRKRYLRVLATVGVAACQATVTFILGQADRLPAVTPEFDVYT
jgi:hypothetical protein